MRVPGTIEKHDPEHQAHVCRFLGIPLHEYEDWLASYNIIHWRRFNNFLMELRDKIEECKRNKDQISLTLKETLRLYGIEDRILNPTQEEHVLELTNRILEEHDINWFLENHGSLIEELEETLEKQNYEQRQGSA